MPNRARIIIVVLAATAAFSAGYGLYERDLRHRLSAVDGSAQQQLAELEERARAAEGRARDLQAQLDAQRDRAAASSSIDDPGPERPDGPPEGPPPPPAGIAFSEFGGGRGGALLALMEDPGFVKLWTTEQRAQLDGRYADLFRSLKLSPAEMEKFKDLLVEKQSAYRDVVVAARAQGLNPRENRAELRQLAQQASAEVDASIRAMLGAEAYDKYQFYEQTAPQRNFVNQLDRRLSYSGPTLNESQSDALVRILAETQSAEKRNATNANAMRARPGAGRVTITPEVINKASGVLDSRQLAALQQLQNEQQVQAQINQLVRENRNRRPAPRPGGGG